MATEESNKIFNYEHTENDWRTWVYSLWPLNISCASGEIIKHHMGPISEEQRMERKQDFCFKAQIIFFVLRQGKY